MTVYGQEIASSLQTANAFVTPRNDASYFLWLKNLKQKQRNN
jgi:hypothetical protein